MKLQYGEEDIEIGSVLPVIPLRDVVILPHMVYPLLVGRPFTIAALQEAMVLDKQVFLCAQKMPDVDLPTQSDLYQVGVVSRILQLMKLPNGTMKVLVEGLVRARIDTFNKTKGFFTTHVKFVPPMIDLDRETEALSRTVRELFSEYVHLNRRIPDEVLLSFSGIEEYQRLADTVTAHILLKMHTKQHILELDSVKKQFRELSRVLRSEIEILRIEQKIDGTVRDALSKDQKEFYLQKQLKAIKEELGQGEDISNEVEDLYEKLEKLDAPEEVLAKAEEELKKLSKMHPYSAESAVVRGYVEWLLALPWRIYTRDRSNFREVKSILDGDHYGLEKAKKRILEHLAVLRVAGKVRGPILCFVGPPGVGKTSVGKSIARSLNRKFVRMSLGGVRDEAEIRGHRRTYIGSLPGRIIQSIKKAGSANPVFLLDEVDKIGIDFRGDPAAALLEVLDPEQNSTFSDNYMEIDYDLSKVLFITTANSLSGIPPALIDRMEIIRLPGYLEHEKLAIAKMYLLPKLKSEMGLGGVSVDINDAAIYEIIRNYTREAGVREVERKLASVLRKVTQQIAEGSKKKKFAVGVKKINDFLGAPTYISTDIKMKPEPGYAVGLAWTEFGGEVLPIEVTLMKGAGKLNLTGKLGEVMRESASAGLSYVRGRAEKFGLEPDFYDKMEIHIHVPEGAVPKDGPSAGITMLVSLLSALTGISVRKSLALTGEITLSGDVIPIGGLNEKLLAAKRSGITDIIMPFKNKKDIPELPKKLVEGMKLHLVKKVDEAINIAFEGKLLGNSKLSGSKKKKK
ncbi:MAG: endopeptidase La [candidate division Zixibacteria bacterium HGW-Zixibacteria-1]|nr:MAG: endopeptidase La [candidate division Zixibacteria bacterium HGW-Zixibacteria-1]